MIDPACFFDPALLVRAAKMATRLDETDFLGGPGRAPGEIDIDPIFGSTMASALADLAVDAGVGAIAADAPFPSTLLGRQLLEVDGYAYHEVTDTQDVPLGVLALTNGAVLAGLYTGCTLVVDNDHEGQGLATRLIILRFILDEVLPLWDHDTPGYSPGGAAAHRAAHRALSALAP